MFLVFDFQRSDALVSLLDIVPTVLDWFSIDYPKYTLFDKNKPIQLTGRSLLPILQQEPSVGLDTVYASHSLHEITMYYPMRVVRNRGYKLIQNLNFLMPFPIDQDFFLSPSFQDILNRTRNHEKLPWFSTLHRYYYREPWELYDLANDPKEMNNVWKFPEYHEVLTTLQGKLNAWQNITSDPWICAPVGVLEDGGIYKDHPRCMSLENQLYDKYMPNNVQLNVVP